MEVVETKSKDRESMKYPNLGYGIGLRPEHFDEILEGQSKLDWFEVLTENYMGITGSGQSPLLKKLLRLRKDYPIVFHCVSTDIGSSDPLDLKFLKQLKELVDLVEPAWISDHLCWTGINGHNTHELLPLPYTEETILHLSERINAIQDFLGQRFMIENTSSYISYKASEMSEWEFISEIISRTDCGLLLDVNNVYVSAQNHGFDAKTFLNQIPMLNVGQIHIAGHDRRENGLIVDTHDAPVCDEVYDLISHISQEHRLPALMAEWDDNIPDLEVYESQVWRAKEIIEGQKRHEIKIATK